MARYRSWPAARQPDVLRFEYAGHIPEADPREALKPESEPTGVPDLRLDRLAVDVDTPRRELDADSRLAFQVELVARESRQYCTLAAAMRTSRRDGPQRGMRHSRLLSLAGALVDHAATHDLPTPESPISTT